MEEPPFKKILVPVDGSQQSKTAQDMAAFLSKLFESKVTIIHVVLNELPGLQGDLYSPREDTVPVNQATIQFPRAIGLPRPKENLLPNEVIGELIDRYLENGQTILTESSALFAANGILAEQKLVKGRDVSEAIDFEAETGSYDIIVMGSSEDQDPSSLHLGSVAKKVAVSTKKHVLIARQKREVRKILIPVDGSKKDEIILKKAEEIAKAANAQTIILHVQETSLLRLKPEISKVGSQVLQHASEMLKIKPIQLKLASGDPARVIIQTAKEADVDLIVMSRGGFGTLKGLFLGSVSEHVLHHSVSSVLLIK